MNENNTYRVVNNDIYSVNNCGEYNMGEVHITRETIQSPPDPKSILWIGDRYYRISLPADQHFNWFQKLMWKWCFGVKVEDFSEE